MRNNPFPNYPDDTDYTTNANSYYDDLARKQKLIELLAKKIWEYDEELAKRFEAWDKNLEDFPEDVKILLQQWVDDGTLDHIINDTIFNWKLDTTIFEQFRDVTTEQLQHIAIIATQHGVKGDGVTDDSQSIISLFNMVNDLGGGTVIFPNTENDYIVNDDINITIDNHVNLSIIGENVRFKRTQDKAGNLFRFVPKDENQKNNVKMMGVILDGIGVEEQWDLTDYAQLKQVRGVTSEVSHFSILDSTIENCYGFGIRCLYFEKVEITNIYMNKIGGSWYQINDFDAFGDAIYLIPKNADSEVTIHHNKLVGYNSSRPRLSRIGVTIEYKGCKVNMYDNTIIGYQRGIHVEGAPETKLTVDLLRVSRYNLLYFLMNGAIEAVFNNVYLSNYEGKGRTSFGGYTGIFTFYDVNTPPFLTEFNNCIFDLNVNNVSVGKNVVFNNCKIVNKTTEQLTLQFNNSDNIQFINTTIDKFRANLSSCTKTDVFGCRLIGKLPELVVMNIVGGDVTRFESNVLEDGILGFENTTILPTDCTFIKKTSDPLLNVFIRPFGKTYTLFNCLFKVKEEMAIVSSTLPKPNYLNCYKLIDTIPTLLS